MNGHNKNRDLDSQQPVPSILKVLLVGPLPIEGDYVGGAKAAFSQLIRDFDTFSSVEYLVINVSRPLKNVGRIRRIFLNLMKFIGTLNSLMLEGKRHDVWAVHVSPHGSFALLPCVRVIAWVHNKPVVVRMFGGSLFEDLSSQKSWVKKLFSWSLSGVSTITLETQYLIERFSSMNNAVWFPNTRNISIDPQLGSQCKQFIFLSQIRSEKGVSEILEAAKLIHPNCKIDMFGSVLEPHYLTEVEVVTNVSYKGELQPDTVALTLREYDALLLPTYWEGEGHPGVIIEAFQCGLPVIATDWNQISEIVTHGKNGLLVEPRNGINLAEAMNLLIEDGNLFLSLAEGAVESGEKYRSTLWHSKFLDWCRAAASSREKLR